MFSLFLWYLQLSTQPKIIKHRRSLRKFPLLLSQLKVQFVHPLNRYNLSRLDCDEMLSHSPRHETDKLKLAFARNIIRAAAVLRHLAFGPISLGSISAKTSWNDDSLSLIIPVRQNLHFCGPWNEVDVGASTKYQKRASFIDVVQQKLHSMTHVVYLKHKWKFEWCCVDRKSKKKSLLFRVLFLST